MFFKVFFAYTESISCCLQESKKQRSTILKTKKVMQKSRQILNVLMHTTHFFPRSVHVDSLVGKVFCCFFFYPVDKSTLDSIPYLVIYLGSRILLGFANYYNQKRKWI